MLWAIFLFAVDTQTPLASPPYRYESEEACKTEASELVRPGWNNAIYQPVSDEAPIRTARGAEEFAFTSFEGLPESDIIPVAQQFLYRNFPVGSDVRALISVLEEAGAKCRDGLYNGEPYYGCEYSTRAHGLMSLVSTVEWKLVIWADKDKKSISSIIVNRGLTGP